MSEHNHSVYNNSCLKIPRRPKSNRPFPLYEQKYINQLQNEARKLSIESYEIQMKNRRVEEASEADKKATKSFLEFIDSIPEYDDVNHLSNKEFYKRLENLKEKQKLHYERMQTEVRVVNRDSEWISDYQNLNICDEDPMKLKRKSSSIKPFCTTPILSKSPKYNRKFDDVEVSSFSDKYMKPPSRRSVRIETPSDKYTPDDTPEPYIRPKSKATSLTPISKETNNDWDNISINDFKLDSDRDYPLESNNLSNTPTQNKASVGWKDSGITIPSPFQMTVRDEENKIVEELLVKNNLKGNGEKQETFRAHPIPVESQIPLFDKIMAEQEFKNHIVRERSKAALEAQMRPFSFTKRDEEMQALTKRLSKSSPSVFHEEEPIKTKQFKAKPIPKNLFSNYIYQKMYEDEFYRGLQRKIRAEEMMRAASLPPSMAKRERNKPIYDVCPRSFRDIDFDEYYGFGKTKKVPIYKKLHERYEKELEDLKNEFISTSPRPFKFKTSRRSERKIKKNVRNSSANSSTRTQSSAEISSVTRSNLAAVLRIQSARKRLENQMSLKLEESKLKEEARWKEKIMRQKPVWQDLAYSHEEDLAMRLRQRKDEERLRNEEHQLRMELMLGRVNQQPTLFERQSQVQYPRTKDELVESLYKEYQATKSSKSRRSLSDLSNYCVEMRDEAIQAFLDDNCDDLKDKEDKPEDKETCDSTNTEENDN